MLGNDIVDLRDAEAQPASFRPRFEERVFSAKERSLIADDANPLARRWAHWAAKEASYKLAKQIDSTFVFSPGRLVPNYQEIREQSRCSERGTQRMSRRFERRGRLELPHALAGGIRMLELRSFECDAWVHVVAAPVGSDWAGVDWLVEALGHASEDPSAAIRALAIREISHGLEVDAERLSIGQKDRIPFVELDGSRTPHFLSFSHHGNWIGFAVRLRAETQHSENWMQRGIDSEDRVAGETCAP